MAPYTMDNSVLRENRRVELAHRLLSQWRTHHHYHSADGNHAGSARNPAPATRGAELGAPPGTDLQFR